MNNRYLILPSSGEEFRCLNCNITFGSTIDNITTLRLLDKLQELATSNSHLNLNLNKLLQMVIDEERNSGLHSILTKKSILALTDLKTILLNRFEHQIDATLLGNRLQYLKVSNPLLIELELQIGEQIPRLIELDYENFGYYAFSNSIISLNLASKELIYLSDRIPLFPNLQYLFLHNNNLQILPNTITNFQRLRFLTLHNNPDIVYPVKLFELSSLKFLSLTDTSQLTESDVVDRLKKLSEMGCEIVVIPTTSVQDKASQYNIRE